MRCFREVWSFLIEVLLCFIAVALTLLLIVPAIIYCLLWGIYFCLIYIYEKIFKAKGLLRYDDEYYLEFDEKDEEDVDEESEDFNFSKEDEDYYHFHY